MSEFEKRKISLEHAIDITKYAFDTNTKAGLGFLQRDKQDTINAESVVHVAEVFFEFLNKNDSHCEKKRLLSNFISFFKKTRDENVTTIKKNNRSFSVLDAAISSESVVEHEEE